MRVHNPSVFAWAFGLALQDVQASGKNIPQHSPDNYVFYLLSNVFPLFSNNSASIFFVSRSDHVFLKTCFAPGNSTLTDEEKNEVIRDGRPNTPNDRKILGMDLYGNSAPQTHSFLQNQKNRPVDGDSCSPPIDLHKKHEEWKKNWKRMPSAVAETDPEECEEVLHKNVTGCTAFVSEKASGPYTCWSGCKIEKPVNPLENLDDTAKGSTGYLYIHKNISSAWS